MDIDKLQRCRPYLEDALRYNDTGQTFEDVVAGLWRGDYRLWPGQRSAIVTEHYVGRQGEHVNLFLAGGDMDELQSLLASIEDEARRQGVVRVTLYGRRGWERTFLKDQGYRPRWVVMTKEL